MEPINIRFKAIREKLNLSQEAFGKRLDVEQGTISGIERGAANVSGNMIHKLITRLKVRRQFIEDGIGDIFSAEDNNQKFIKELKTSPPLTESDYANENIELRKEISELKEILRKLKEELAITETSLEFYKKQYRDGK
jgi:transcriptional regulator with XRE-family HTH domain